MPIRSGDVCLCLSLAPRRSCVRPKSRSLTPGCISFSFDTGHATPSWRSPPRSSRTGRPSVCFCALARFVAHKTWFTLQSGGSDVPSFQSLARRPGNESCPAETCMQGREESIAVGCYSQIMPFISFSLSVSLSLSLSCFAPCMPTRATRRVPLGIVINIKRKMKMVMRNSSEGPRDKNCTFQLKKITPPVSSKSHWKCKLHLEFLCGVFSYSAGWASDFKSLFLKNSSHLLRIQSCVSSSLRADCCGGAVTAATCLYTCHYFNQCPLYPGFCVLRGV